MHTKIFKTVFALVATIGFTVQAHATPVTYDFTASNFVAQFSAPIPAPTIIGSFTLDDGALIGVDLTLGGHVFNASELGTQLPPSGSTILIGGLLNNVNRLVLGTTDFFFSFNRSNFNATRNFRYSLDGVIDTFRANTLIITERNETPEPAMLALFGIAAAAAVTVQRKRHV